MKIIEKYVNNIPNTKLIYFIGQNSQDNYDLVHRSKPNDWWFHIANISSCHVVANIPTEISLDKKQTMTIIKHGAIICKAQMTNKIDLNSKIEIIYSQIKNVENILPIGKVSVYSSKKIQV